jgi:putative ABC transport system substrate-binding protein
VEIRHFFSRKITFFAALALLSFLGAAGPAPESCPADRPLHIGIVQSKALGPYQFVQEETVRLLHAKGFRVRTSLLVVEDMAQTEAGLRHLLEKDRPDVVLAIGSEPAVLTVEIVTDIPVIFSMVYRTDPIEKAVSANPNARGVFLNLKLDQPLEVVKKIDPEVKKVGVIYSPSLFQMQVGRIEEKAGQLGLSVIRKELNAETDIPDAVRTITEEADAVFLLPDPLTMTQDFLKKLMIAAVQKKIFVFGESFEWVKKGALAGFAFDIQEVVHRTSRLMEGYLATGSTGGLCSTDCESYRLFLNLRVAETIGITISREVLKEAEKTGKVVE